MPAYRNFTGALSAENMAPSLAVGGWVPFSATDWPGKLAAVVFTQGCPWRCPYCQNPHLWPARGKGGVAWPDVAAFLSRRQGLLDAVVFSGGEPTMHPALIPALADVRHLGFATGLHTGGGYPEHLREALPLLDWVGFDLKTVPERYAELTGAPAWPKVEASLDGLLASGVSCEVRTTVHPLLLKGGEILRMAAWLRSRGVDRYALQVFRPQGCSDSVLAAGAGPLPLDEAQMAALRGIFPELVVRAG